MLTEKTTEINENLKLIQKTDGLTYGSDAFLLSAYVSGGQKQKAVDLGSGTGIIPLLCLAKSKAQSVTAVEVQESFADLIGRNAALNDFADRLTPLCIDLRELTAAKLGFEADFVTANPPYMKADSGKRNAQDEKFIARHEVFGGIEDFCACASRILKHGGRFYCVFRPDRLIDLLSSMREHKLEPKVMTFVSATADSQPSMALIRAVKGGAGGMTVTRNLILHNSKGDAKHAVLSPDAQRIYDTCSFAEFFEK